MKIARLTKRFCRTLPLAAFCTFANINIASAGTFTYNPGSWGTFTGTGSSDAAARTADSDSGAISPSLTLTSSTSSQNYTLGATYNFTVKWLPNTGDTAPTSVTVVLNKQYVLGAFGTGIAKLLQGYTVYAEMDSTNDALAGFTTFISQPSLTLPLVLQTDGSYLATGSVTTDTLSVTYNSSTGGNTSSEESFSLDSMTPNP